MKRHLIFFPRIITLIALMMMLGGVDLWADTWNGTTIYTTLAAADIKGAGTEENPYIIDDANKFVAFGALPNSSDTKYWKLTTDIDLGGNEWPYSGNNAKTFKGHFDGGGYIVKNFTITPITNKANGLFGTVQGSNATTGRAEIKDLKIDDVTITTTENLGSTTHIGALVGNSNQYVDFKNIQIVDANSNGQTVNITLDNLTGNCNIGGLIGQFQKYSTMEDCTVNNPVILIQGEGTVAGECRIGGAIGYCTGSNATDVTKIDKPTSGSENGLTVNNPSVTVHKILSSWYISTAIGRINNYSDVNYVTVANPTLIYKAVGSPNNDLYLGTFAGHIQGNVGSATANPVATNVRNISVTGTSNLTIGTGTEEIKKVRAGVVGQVSAYAVIDTWNIANTNVTVNANITTSTDYIGGGFGMVQSTSTAADADVHTTVKDVTIANSTVAVTGYISKESYIGGAVGRIEGTVGDASKKPQYISVTGLKITETSQVTLGTNATDEINAAKAGVAGAAVNYSTISGWNIATSNVTVNGKLATGVCYLGGCIGQVTSNNPTNIKTESPIPTTIDDVTLGSSTITVSGDIQKESYVGGAFGQITGNAGSATTNPQQTSVTNLKVTGTATVNLCANNTNTINFVKAGVAGYVITNVNIANWTIANTNVQVNGTLITTDSYVGGGIGHLRSAENGPILVDNINISTSSVIGINGNVDKNIYVGGAFGRMDSDQSTRNKSVTAMNVNVKGLDLSFGGNFTQNVYAGGIVGYLYAMNTTNCPEPTSLINCSAQGQIHSSASKTFLQDRTYAFGGIVGYNNQNATTNQSIIKQCVSEVDFNLSGYTPATEGATGYYNLYKNGFVVGGVIGRLDNPSLLPEHVYYSGKIYAPFAAVAPVVGVFYTKLDAAAYLYNDYSGDNAAFIATEELKKTDSWYYNGYKLGLSSEVISQTARTKNYKTSPDVDNGVSYLTVDDKTFDRPNEISGAVKNSYTVLAYTANNTDKDMGIFPQWNTNSATYPAYYMYYMQGLNRGKYVPDDEVDFVKTLMSSGITFYPTLTRTGDDEHGYVFTVDPGDAEVTDGFTLTYQWYQSDKTTPMPGETGKALSISKDDLEAVGNTVFCVVTVSGTGFTSVSRTLRGMYAIVVFVNGNNYAKHGAKPGLDTNDGMTPQTPVKTIDKANSLLDGGPWDKNIIVVMGLLNPGTDEAFRSKGTNPATLTGKWDGLNYEGEIKIVKTGETGANNTQSGSNGFHNYVKGDTKFEYLTIRANKNSDDNNFLDCHGNDVWFGKGLVMTNFGNLGKNHGNLEGAQKVPELTVLMTATNLSEADIQAYTNRSKPQTLTIESGHYGRILAGRFTQAFFTNSGNTSHTILGSAAHPLWAVINVDIDKDNQMTDGGSTTYTCDINCIIAGLTDGSMYGDFEINVHGGKVEYVVGGNQGNPAANGSETFTQPGGKPGNWGQWPNASFYGRSVINVEQDSDLKEITIGNLYAGGLGRDLQSSGSATVVDMYMYGQTEINMKSGTVTGNVYGGGAGGVIGLSPWDMHLPYATMEADNATNAVINKVQYGTWGSMPAGSPLTSVTLHKPDGNGGYTTTPLDLSESSTTLNISGGTINGSVYGGGCGFVNNMPDKVAMQGVGSVFGTSNVNVSGGTINGSVYGGSEGDPGYYDETNNYGQTINHIAEMNGTVNLKVTGTDALYPTIGGNIYGAGMGIASEGGQEYLRIATAGNADLGDKYKTNINILIDLPESHPFQGNIYGGGQMGAVDGNTTVVIKGGTIEGDVFGGGQGEEGHPEKAKVTGDTHVIVDKNWTPE